MSEGIPVLIVDDDVPSVHLLRAVLELAGFEVRAAQTAEDALQTLRSFHPRAVVIDLILPLMSGLLLAQTLKADPRTADMVLVAVTAFNGREAERLARDAGYALYVRKPIDPLSFADLLLGALRGTP